MDFSTIKKSFARCLAWIREYQNQRYSSFDGAQRAGIKSISLAFACTVPGGKIKRTHLDIAAQWASEQMLYSDGSAFLKRRFQKAVKNSAAFLNRNPDFDPAPMCSQIAAVLPISDRYAVIDLCIRVSVFDRTLSPRQVNMLRVCSKWLGLDSDRFRLMIEKHLPIDTDVNESDIELLFGIDPDMSNEQIQNMLTEEFRKWNARITNQNPAIRARADKMIRIITAHRVAYQI